MTKDFESKSHHQALAHVVEECGEVIAAAGKLYRFGAYSSDPTKNIEDQETNIDWFERELSDLNKAIKAYRSFVS